MNTHENNSEYPRPLSDVEKCRDGVEHIAYAELDRAYWAMNEVRNKLDSDLDDIDRFRPGLIDGEDEQLDYLVSASRVAGGLYAIGVIETLLKRYSSKPYESGYQMRLFDPKDL